MKRVFWCAIIFGIVTLPLFGKVDSEKCVADSLAKFISPYLNSQESYFIQNNGFNKFSNQFIKNFLDENIDVKASGDFASKIINLELNKEIKTIKKRSFLFSRFYEDDLYSVDIKIINNNDNKIEFCNSTQFIIPQREEPKEIKLWTPLIISIITGTVIYSLWAIK